MRVRTERKRIAHHIAAWREYRGLKQYQLADLIGTDRGNLSRVETGKQAYTQDLLESIAAVLKVSPAALIGQHPADPTGMWALWAQADGTQRQQIAELARVLLKSAA